MSPREREQWHACRMFLFHRVGARFDRNGQPLPATTLEFSITVHDYLAQPDAHERRKLLIEHGCPDAIVDLADGTHLDIVEGP